MRKRVFLLTILTLLLCSLAALGKTIDIESKPSRSSIYIISDDNNTRLKVGETPFKTTLDEFLKRVNRSFFVIEIKKEGFKPYRVLFSKVSNVDINLEVQLDIDSTIKQIKKYDKMISELFEAQRLIRSSDYSDAITQLTKLEDSFKDFSIITELKATAHYLNKDPIKALTFYRKAFSKNPQNSDAFKMKEYLEKKLSVAAKSN